MTTAETAETADALADALRAEGFRPGAPAALAPQVAAVDKQLCGRLRCAGCKGRGMSYRPFTNGKRYRVVAACPTCNAAEEV